MAYPTNSIRYATIHGLTPLTHDGGNNTSSPPPALVELFIAFLLGTHLTLTESRSLAYRMSFQKQPQLVAGNNTPFAHIRVKRCQLINNINKNRCYSSNAPFPVHIYVCNIICLKKQKQPNSLIIQQVLSTPRGGMNVAINFPEASPLIPKVRLKSVVVSDIPVSGGENDEYSMG